MSVPHYDIVELTDAEIEQERTVFGGLAESIRSLNDASLRSTVAAEEIEDIRREVERLTARLQRAEIPGAFGVSFTPGGSMRGYGNAVVGLRNPHAVPLEIRRDGTGLAEAAFTLGALHEGPPGCVHGGVLALLLDQVMGESASDGGSPGMTGTLTLRYLRPTPLGDCSIRAWIDRVEGIKTFVHAEFSAADGEPTVSVEGIFVTPKWVRDLRDPTSSESDTAEQPTRPPRFE